MRAALDDLACSSTMISSQSRIVLRRWAMMMQVQPRRRRLSSIAFSVIGSSAAVASSSTRIVGLPTSARAISIRWRWPPLKFVPPSRDVAIVIAGRVAMSSWIDASLSAWRCRPRHGRVPQREVVARGALEQEDVLIDIGERIGEHLRRNLRQRPAVDSESRPPRLVQAADQPPSVDLPLPEAPTSATRMPGSSVEGEPSISGGSSGDSRTDVAELERPDSFGGIAFGALRHARPRSTG